MGFQWTKAFDRFQHAGGRALRQRFTFRLTRRTVPIMFSIGLAQARSAAWNNYGFLPPLSVAACPP
jgi:hypothetical protein